MDLFWATFSFSLRKCNNFGITWLFCIKIVESVLSIFFKEDLSCTMVVRTGKEKMGWSFNLLTATTSRIYALMKIVPKLWSAKWCSPSLILVRNFNLWLGSCLTNFRITLIKTLQEVELILFHSIITAGKNSFWKIW